jgi:hypothetical protein
MRPPRSGQGASPGGGDLQPEPGHGVRCSIRNARSPSAIAMTTATRGGRRGSWASPPMRTHRLAVMERRCANVAVDWSNMSGSASSSPPRGAEVSSSRRLREARRDKTVGSSSRPAAPPARVDQWSACSRAAPSRTGASEPQRPVPRHADPPRRSEERPVSARQLYDGSDHPDSDSLQRRQSRRRSSDSASMPSASPAEEPSVAPRRLQSLLIRGGGAPDVHVSLVAGGGHVLTVYFGAPSMFITLWFGFDYGTNPPLGMLII